MRSIDGYEAPDSMVVHHCTGCGTLLADERYKAYYRLRVKGDMLEWPEDLRVREYPSVKEQP